MNKIREQVKRLARHLRLRQKQILSWPGAYHMGAHDTNVCNQFADTMEKMLAVVEAVVKLGEDCRYDADDWVLSPELAQK
ncbi:hypothetical protein LCGC14_2588540, partial [marine sediment metagenome]